MCTVVDLPIHVVISIIFIMLYFSSLSFSETFHFVLDVIVDLIFYILNDIVYYCILYVQRKIIYIYIYIGENNKTYRKQNKSYGTYLNLSECKR